MDGILCLADILTDESNAEAARAEAAAVVAQITSPHHTFTQHLGSFLENMQDIVTALISESQPAHGDFYTGCLPGITRSHILVAVSSSCK